MTSQQRRIIVYAMPWRRIDVDSTLFQCCVPAGEYFQGCVPAGEYLLHLESPKEHTHVEG